MCAHLGPSPRTKRSRPPAAGWSAVTLVRPGTRTSLSPPGCQAGPSPCLGRSAQSLRLPGSPVSAKATSVALSTAMWDAGALQPSPSTFKTFLLPPPTIRRRACVLSLSTAHGPSGPRSSPGAMRTQRAETRPRTSLGALRKGAAESSRKRAWHQDGGAPPPSRLPLLPRPRLSSARRAASSARDRRPAAGWPRAPRVTGG
mmetsp:Transcript_19761/g.66438  ORF Transcript_19761/g.66438 Transcript_19761/m.66438 type:complete len:201 (-) Transcript_19761:126-728(-)